MKYNVLFNFDATIYNGGLQHECVFSELKDT